MTCDPQSLLDAARCFSCIPAGMLASVGTNLLCQLTNLPEEPIGECVHPVETDWYNRIVAGGATPPTDQQRFWVCRFCQALDAAGITNKFLSMNIYLPGDLNRMLYPLLPSSPNPDSAAWVNHNFVAADLTNNGLVGDGLTKYLDTGCDPSFLIPYDDAGLTSVNSENILVSPDPTSRNLGVAAFDPDVAEVDFELANDLGLGAYGFPGQNGPVGETPDIGTFVVFPAGPNPFVTAFVSMSRLAANDLKMYWGGNPPAVGQPNGFAQIDQNLNLPPVDFLPGGNVYVHCINYTDMFGVPGPARFSVLRISFAAIHHGLTFNETRDLYNAVQDLRVHLGGGNV